MKQTARTPPAITITNCHFIGVQWSEPAMAMAQTIAQGLLVNAEAFSKLAEVLKASNVHFEAMLKVTPLPEEPSSFTKVTR